MQWFKRTYGLKTLVLNEEGGQCINGIMGVLYRDLMPGQGVSLLCIVQHFPKTFHHFSIEQLTQAVKAELTEVGRCNRKLPQQQREA